MLFLEAIIFYIFKSQDHNYHKLFIFLKIITIKNRIFSEQILNLNNNFSTFM